MSPKGFTALVLYTALLVCSIGWHYRAVLLPGIRIIALDAYAGALLPPRLAPRNLDPDPLRRIEYAYGLIPGLLTALGQQESGWNPRATRFEPHLLRADARIRILPEGIRAQAATSYGLFQILGIEALSRGVPIDDLTQPLKAAELSASMLAVHIYASPFRTASLALATRDALAKYNCGPSKGGIGRCGDRYAQEVLARL